MSRKISYVVTTGVWYLVLAVAGSLCFAEADVSKTEAGVAIDGYDVVAYFQQDTAIKGSADFKAEHDGVIYYFSSKENHEAFTVTPGRYLPKYGGYCAFAVAMKKATVKANPDTFKLYNGELYLFFNDLYEGEKFNTKIPWNLDEQNLQARAEQHWVEMTAAAAAAAADTQ